MKTGVSTALKNHLASRYQTTATCWKVTRRDGVVKAYTDHDQDILVPEGSPVIVRTYLAASGYTASNIESSDALNVDTLEVEGMLVSDSITEDDLRAGLWDYAQVEIFIVNWADISMGTLIQRVGTLGEVTLDRGMFKAELRGLTQAFTRSIGELTSPGCRASLGDERCRVDLTPFTVIGTVDSVNADNMTIFDAARTEPGPGEEAGSPVSESVEQIGVITLIQGPYAGGRSLIVVDSALGVVSGSTVAVWGVSAAPELNGLWIAREAETGGGGTSNSFYVDQAYTGSPSIGSPSGADVGRVTLLGTSSGYFDFGVLTWTSGLNNGLAMEVKQYVQGMIVLALPMPFAIQAGDTYSMHAGCDKLLETCRDRFNNIVNMRAEPYLPGIDRVVQVARRQ